MIPANFGVLPKLTAMANISLAKRNGDIVMRSIVLYIRKACLYFFNDMYLFIVFSIEKQGGGFKPLGFGKFCPKWCPSFLHEPKCGSDGITYKNKCEFTETIFFLCK